MFYYYLSLSLSLFSLSVLSAVSCVHVCVCLTNWLFIGFVLFQSSRPQLPPPQLNLVFFLLSFSTFFSINRLCVGFVAADPLTPGGLIAQAQAQRADYRKWKWNELEVNYNNRPINPRYPFFFIPIHKGGGRGVSRVQRK